MIKREKIQIFACSASKKGGGGNTGGGKIFIDVEETNKIA